MLNKNEVRKWFEDYRSCRNMLNSNKLCVFVCLCREGASNKTSRINECILKNNWYIFFFPYTAFFFHLWLQSRLDVFTARPLPSCHLGENAGGGRGHDNSLQGAANYVFRERPPQSHNPIGYWRASVHLSQLLILHKRTFMLGLDWSWQRGERVSVQAL